MLFDISLFILVAISGFIACFGQIFYPRDKHLFRSQPAFLCYSKRIFPVLLFILCIRSFLFEPIKINNSNMQPTLLDGEYVIIDKFSHGLHLPILNYRLTEGNKPMRGDIATTKHNYQTKRIIGLPGDHIEYKNGSIYINKEKFVIQSLNSVLDVQQKTKELDVYVPPHNYLIIDDKPKINTNAWDFINEADIIGKPRYILFSLDFSKKIFRWSRLGSIA